MIERNGSCTEAIRLLREALEQRPEASANARTYSMIVIEYDPYYWLAVAQKQCGEVAAARASLESARRAGVTDRGTLDKLERELGIQVATATPTPSPVPRAAPTPAATNHLTRVQAPGMVLQLPGAATFDNDRRIAKVGWRELPLPPGEWQLTFERNTARGWGDGAGADRTWEILKMWRDAGATFSCEGDFASSDLVRAAGCMMLAPESATQPSFLLAAGARLDALAGLRTAGFTSELNRLLVRLQERGRV
jgi:hypothetical protein